MKLIIFDIDQTLINVLDFHNQAASKTFKNFFNLEAKLDEVDFTGKTMTQNLSELARAKGIAESIIKEKIDAMLDFYGKAFEEAIPENLDKYILPGVRILLDRSKDQNFLAIVTGNSARVANKILENSGLKKYFKVITSGEQGKDRRELVGQAIAEAEKRVKEKFSEVIVIGDSIHDIESAKPFGAKSIAVCTGYHTKEQLLEHNPDRLVPDLSDTEEILKIING